MWSEKKKEFIIHICKWEEKVPTNQPKECENDAVVIVDWFPMKRVAEKVMKADSEGECCAIKEEKYSSHM